MKPELEAELNFLTWATNEDNPMSFETEHTENLAMNELLAQYVDNPALMLALQLITQYIDDMEAAGHDRSKAVSLAMRAFIETDLPTANLNLITDKFLTALQSTAKS